MTSSPKTRGAATNVESPPYPTSATSTSAPTASAAPAPDMGSGWVMPSLLPLARRSKQGWFDPYKSDTSSFVEKIVVGIDGSNASRDALRWAVEDARARGAEVVALHAYEVPVPAPDAAPSAPVDLPALIGEVHDDAQQFVTKVVDEVVGNAVSVDVAPMAVEDAPARALLDASRDADLLVVGSHGHGLSGLLLGSVSLECAQHAACPVLIFRGSVQAERPTASND